jgi:hypothetical protein
LCLQQLSERIYALNGLPGSRRSERTARPFRNRYRSTLHTLSRSDILGRGSFGNIKTGSAEPHNKNPIDREIPVQDDVTRVAQEQSPKHVSQFALEYPAERSRVADRFGIIDLKMQSVCQLSDNFSKRGALRIQRNYR